MERLTLNLAKLGLTDMNFIKYLLIGILNTSIHWAVFYFLFFLDFSQSVANLVAFFVAVSFSYLINAKYNFNLKPRVKNYFLFLLGMGVVNFLIGKLADFYNFASILTLFLTSTLSLALGFTFSKFFVFKER